MSQSTKAEQSAIAQLFAPESMGTIKVLDTTKHEHIASLPDGELITNLAIQLLEIKRLEAELSEHQKIIVELKAELKSRKPKGKRGRPSNSDGWPELANDYRQHYENEKDKNPRLTLSRFIEKRLAPIIPDSKQLKATKKTIMNNIGHHSKAKKKSK